jgi:hypothetical protein
MRELKPNENGEYSDAVQALQLLKYDTEGEDPTETADQARIEGNKHFKFKKYRWAIDAYTNGEFSVFITIYFDEIFLLPVFESFYLLLSSTKFDSINRNIRRS